MTDTTAVAAVTESAPVDPPYKAIVGAALAVVLFVGLAWLTDTDTCVPVENPKHPKVQRCEVEEGFTEQEFKDALLGALVASGLIGSGVYVKSNKPSQRRRRNG